MTAQEKREASMNRSFGVEIEFANLGELAAARAIEAAGIECHPEGYNHTTRSWWKVVSDSSCGYEAVSPPLHGEEGIAEVQKVVKALREAGATVNKNCGLHVHHDARDFTGPQLRNMALLYVKYEKVLDSLQPTSRRDSVNGYCMSLLKEHAFSLYGRASHASTDEEKIVAAMNSINRTTARYLNEPNRVAERLATHRMMKLNYEAYFRHGTIEVRHGAGSLDGRKIAEWIRLTAGMMTAAQNTKTFRWGGYASLNSLMKFASVSRKTRNYLRARQQHLAQMAA